MANINITSVFLPSNIISMIRSIDLCEITYEKENTTGIIGETNISIIQLNPE